MVHDVAEGGFGAGADAYERGRPGYPDDAVAWLVDRVGVGAGRRVADVAAGTGKLTRLLAATGAELVGVEPVPAMRATFAAAVPGIALVGATAEALPFAAASLDAVTVAQAFHWFDPAAALAEAARVLRPGGGLGLVWNERDAAEPWVAELSRLIRWDERGRWRVPYTVEVDWAAVLDAHGGPFGAVESYRTSFRHPMDADTLVARVRSTSYLAVRPAAELADLEARVRALVAPLGARFDLPYVTVAYATRRT